MPCVQHRDGSGAHRRGARGILAANEGMAKVRCGCWRSLQGSRRRTSLSRRGDGRARPDVSGLVGMMDPPREEAMDAVRTCREVHIRPMMITGDHRLTAVAVATEIGIYRDGDLVLTGDELARMDDAAFAGDRRAGERVCARVADGQTQDRARMEAARPRRGDDRRRRQRRARR